METDWGGRNGSSLHAPFRPWIKMDDFCCICSHGMLPAQVVCLARISSWPLAAEVMLFFGGWTLEDPSDMTTKIGPNKHCVHAFFGELDI